MSRIAREFAVERATWSKMLYRANILRCGVSAEFQEFDDFLSFMGMRPPGATFLRIDASRGFSRDNCKWLLKAKPLLTAPSTPKTTTAKPPKAAKPPKPPKVVAPKPAKPVKAAKQPRVIAIKAVKVKAPPKPSRPRARSGTTVLTVQEWVEELRASRAA